MANVSSSVVNQLKYSFEEINPKDLDYIQTSYDYEKFDFNGLRELINNNFTWLYGMCIAYIITIFGIQAYMKNRPAFDLKKPLLIWNLALAVFSIIGISKVIPELLYDYFHYGFYNTNCSRLEVSHSLTFWYSAFAISKIFEFGDTLFIVLRKKPLIFLHWYHHASVLLVTMYCMNTFDNFTVNLAALNYAVHSVMYTYFAAKAADVKINKTISMGITTMQLVQFSIGLAVLIYVYFIKSFGHSCHASNNVIKTIFIVNISYLALFGNFFLKSYFQKNKKVQ